MNKIAYIELDTHAEIASNFRELMQGSEEFSVDYFFSDRILKLLNLKENENIFKSDSKQIFSQLQSGKYDLVIIGTAHRYFNVFEKIAANFKTAVIIHNLNFSKTSKSELLKLIFKKDFVYRLKLLLKEGLLKAPEVFLKAKFRLVLDKNLASEKFRFLPIFFSKYDNDEKNSVVKIVVPGAVSQARRDYKTILEKLNKFISDQNFEITFLGKANEPELGWLQDLENSSPENVSIKYFTEKVPQNQFDEIMNNADILWCPVQQQTEFFSQTEFYGKTKMSGNIGDAIKYSKPAVFPKSFASNLNFIFPEKNDVEAQFLEIANHKTADFSEFKIEKIKDELHSILRKIMS